MSKNSLSRKEAERVSDQMPWRKVILKRSSRRNTGWEWVPTGVCFFARWATTLSSSISLTANMPLACIRWQPTRSISQPFIRDGYSDACYQGDLL